MVQKAVRVWRSLFSWAHTVHCTQLISSHHGNKIVSPQNQNLLNGVRHKIFNLFLWFESIRAPDKKTKVFANSVSISPRYSIIKLENSDSTVCITPRSQNFRLIELLLFILQIFKSNQRPAKFSILAPWCAAPECDAQSRVFKFFWITWLRGLMHTAEFDYAV